MRIVHVAPSYAPCVGGAERLLQSVCEELVRRGHHITVLTFDCATQRDFKSRHGAGLPPDEMLNGVRVVRVNPNGLGISRFYQWWIRQRGGWRTSTWLLGQHGSFTMGTPNGFGALLPMLRLDADLICSVNWRFGVAYWACLMQRLRGVPLVAVPLFHIEQEWARCEIYVSMLRRCDAVIVCTAAEREFVRARSAVAVTVAGAGVDPTPYQQRDGAMIRARHGIGARAVVGFVGRQDVNKGVPTLIEAMRSVWRQLPDAMLLMAGPGAHRHREVNRALDALQPAERQRIVLIDDFPNHDGPSIIDACDVLALPSKEEAFGLVMVEAWMRGKPVIGADIPSTRCIVEHGVDGWLVTPGDSDDLASRILELLVNPDLRANFGQRGRAKALARYTVSRVADHWERTYRQTVRK